MRALRTVRSTSLGRRPVAARRAHGMRRLPSAARMTRLNRRRRWTPPLRPLIPLPSVVVTLITVVMPLAFVCRLFLRVLLRSSGASGVFAWRQRKLTFPGLPNPRVEVERQLMRSVLILTGTRFIVRIVLARYSVRPLRVTLVTLVRGRTALSLPPVSTMSMRSL